MIEYKERIVEKIVIKEVEKIIKQEPIIVEKIVKQENEVAGSVLTSASLGLLAGCALGFALCKYK